RRRGKGGSFRLVCRARRNTGATRGERVGHSVPSSTALSSGCRRTTSERRCHKARAEEKGGRREPSMRLSHKRVRGGGRRGAWGTGSVPRNDGSTLGRARGAFAYHCGSRRVHGPRAADFA